MEINKKRKTMMIVSLTIIAFALNMAINFQIEILLHHLGKVVLSLVLVIMQYLKYYDKKQRNTK